MLYTPKLLRLHTAPIPPERGNKKQLWFADVLLK